MDVKRIRRRAFWIGFRSVWDLSGERTAREWQALAREILPPDPEPSPLWTWNPPTTQVFTWTGLPSGTYTTWDSSG